jgi:hypothetical protein
VDSIGSRVQRFSAKNQTLVLGSIAQARSTAGVFAPSDVDALFDEIGLPRPAKVSNHLRVLATDGDLTSLKSKRGAWKLTPVGVGHVESLVTQMDLAALAAEAASPEATILGRTAHPVIPPSLAPPALIGPLHAFLKKFPFERNVFGMTRFPGTDEDLPDPLARSIEAAKTACERHGFVFHLASDRKIVDELWPNVAAHMWACRYGIAFFESRTERGLNYNLNIEVGSCLVLGRRMALLKDASLTWMPTDLVGHIYHDVDLDRPSTVDKTVDDWIVDSLNLGSA